MLSNPFLPKSNCPHQRRLQILADNEATYNVIMTDSDPVRPAESLYQKPFLQLLHDALTQGTSTHTGCVSEYNGHHSKYISFSGHKTGFHLAKPGDCDIYLYDRGLGAI